MFTAISSFFLETIKKIALVEGLVQVGNYVGVPGTPQVVGLRPGPQTLFYPASGNIAFRIKTFTANQIDTNSIRLRLNQEDVSANLVITRDGLVDLRNDYAVSYNALLKSNAIYKGEITVLDVSGRGTTNHWVFDTFATNGTLIIEAEDYNFASGQFQDDPPPSGLTRDGSQVNGNGIGYFDFVGTQDIDYYDTATFLRFGEHQYRSSDGVGTSLDLNLSRDTPRQKHVNAGVADYQVDGLTGGEWLNYTRTFADGSYVVYLRASSQKAQAVRVDEITGDRTQPDQMKAIKGLFLVPNTGSSTRFRYVPLSDAAGNIRTLNLSGVRTLRLTDLESSRKNAYGVGDLQLNYLMFVPTNVQASPRLPWIAYASPARGSKTADPEQTMQIVILDGDTPLDPTSIRLHFDETNVTEAISVSTNTTDGPGVTVSYHPPGFLLPNSSHSIKVVFTDNTGNRQAERWRFRVEDLPLISTNLRETEGPDTAFTVLVNKSQNENPNFSLVSSWPNTSYRAERQLRGELRNPDTLQPFPNEAAGTNNGFYTEPDSINYEQSSFFSAGFFGGDKTYPGIDPVQYDYNPDHFVIAATIKLQLGAGVYRMGVNSDDGFKVTAGPQGTNLYIASSETFPATRNDGQFDFVVETDGVYKFRLLQWEGGGGANVEWYWVDRTNGTRWLINSPRPTSP